jgi:hypothetical protein
VVFLSLKFCLYNWRAICVIGGAFAISQGCLYHCKVVLLKVCLYPCKGVPTWHKDSSPEPIRAAVHC